MKRAVSSTPNLRILVVEDDAVDRLSIRRALLARSKADVQRSLGLDAATLRELEGRTVHVDPYATIAVWDGPKLTLYDKTQWVDNVQQQVALAFDAPQAGCVSRCRTNSRRQIPCQ